MKTLMNHLKFGTLLTGLIFFSSCADRATIDPEFVNNSGLNSSLEILLKIQDIERNNASSYFVYSSGSKKNQMAALKKHSDRPVHTLTSLPISFGISDATLIAN